MLGRYTLLFRRIERSLGEADCAIIGIGLSVASISIPACSKCEPLSVFVLPNGCRISCELNSSALLADGRASCTGWFVSGVGCISHVWSVVGVCVEELVRGA